MCVFLYVYVCVCVCVGPKKILDMKSAEYEAFMRGRMWSLQGQDFCACMCVYAYVYVCIVCVYVY